MAWPVKHLSNDDKDAIREELEKLTPWLKSEIQHWPKDGCSDTVCVLIDEIRKRLDNYGFRFTVKNGYFDDAHHWEVPHTWIEIADGTIIDPTAGQFIPGPALQFFSSGDPRYLYKRR